MPSSETRPYIGGQAVIEGVMMRSPRSFAVVVRRRAGELVVRERPMVDARRGVLAWPLVRGIASLVEALRLGSEALRFSAELYEQDWQDEDAPPRSAGANALRLLSAGVVAIATHDPETPELDANKTAASHHERAADLSPEQQDPAALVPLPSPTPAPAPTPSASTEATPTPSSASQRAATAFGIVFALGLFVALPQLAAAFVSRVSKLDLDVRSPLFQLLTGAFKLTIVIGYLLLIRRMSVMRRVFQYHGAEHKTISTYEAGQALVVDNARSKTRLHPRCGTTFIIMIALVSVVVFSVVGSFLPQFGLGKVADNLLLFVAKLPFLPVLAAITFELQRLFARYCTTGPLRVVLWPGFLVQRITTIEPDDDQLEIALASLRATLWREQAHTVAPGVVSERSFTDFAALSADAGYGPAIGNPLGQAAAASAAAGSTV